VLCRYGRLSELCYCGTEPVEGVNLGSLVGLHSSYLNGLRRRAEEEASGSQVPGGGIPGRCLVDFFRQEWALALVHEEFPALASALRAALLQGREGSGPDPSVEALCASMEQIMASSLEEEAGSQADPELRDAIDCVVASAAAEGVGVGGSKLGPEAKDTVKKMVALFLKANAPLLPTYLST
jgi:hypothetical protein